MKNLQILLAALLTLVFLSGNAFAFKDLQKWQEADIIRNSIAYTNKKLTPGTTLVVHKVRGIEYRYQAEYVSMDGASLIVSTIGRIKANVTLGNKNEGKLYAKKEVFIYFSVEHVEFLIDYPDPLDNKGGMIPRGTVKMPMVTWHSLIFSDSKKETIGKQENLIHKYLLDNMDPDQRRGLQEVLRLF